MNPSTPTYPAKSVTLKGWDSATSISSGIILQAYLKGSAVNGLAWYKGQPHKFTTVLTLAQLVAGWPSINVAVKVASGEYRSTYISAGSVTNVHSDGGKTMLDLSHELDGIQYGSIVVSETVAQVLALLAAASSGGTGQQITTGTTPVVVNQSNVNVVTVTTPGQVVQLSDLFIDTLIINTSASYFLVKPPTGSAIDNLSTNSGLRVLGYSVVRFSRISALSWISVVERQSGHSYTSAATGSATVVTARTALLTTSASTNNFFQIGDSATGESPDFVTATNTSGANTAKMKFAGAFIDASGANVASPWDIAPSTTVKFTLMQAVGRYLAIVVA